MPYRLLAHVLCVVLALFTLSTPVWAQDKGDENVPKGLENPPASEGFQAYNAGDYPTAIVKLEAAKQTDPSGVVWLWLAKSHAAANQPLEAADAFQFALAASDKPLKTDQRREAEQGLEDARAKIVSVSVTSSVAGATLSIDGAAKQALPLTSHRMAAGDHTFLVEAPGHEPVTRTVTLNGGGQAQLELNPTKTPPPPPPPAPLPPPPPPASDGGGTTGLVMRTTGIGLAVLGALAAGVGVASLINAQSVHETNADDKAKHDAQFGQDCSRGDYTACYVSGLAINENVERADNLQALGIGMTVGGGAFLVGGIVLYLLAPNQSQEAASAQRFSCGPYALGGLSCSGSF